MTVLGSRVELEDEVWSVWSEAPGVGCFWLVRRVGGKAEYMKARKYKDEWRKAE